MRYLALASDYDGTLASDGRLLDDTRAALERLRASGRKVILVTGRRVDDLQRVCPDLSTFEVVVAENGAVLYWPATREVRGLAEPPPAVLAETLIARGVPDVARGHVIVATWQPHENTVLDVIRELGLEMQVIFNKGAVMVLPSGVNKGTGLRAALEALHLSPHNVVGVGDAENDHALLALCECGAAVANALPMLCDRADIITRADHGAGVVELVNALIESDLTEVADRLTRHDLRIGVDAQGNAVTLPAFGSVVLLAGTSGGGKSTFTTAFLERLQESAYQYCIIDPEGDYENLPGAVMMGDSREGPPVDRLLKLLDDPAQNAVVNLMGVGLEGRPAFFDQLMPRLQSERTRAGHPHWIVIDEVHHLAPQIGNTWSPDGALTNVFMITVHPEHVSRALLAAVDVCVVIGVSPRDTLHEFAKAIGVAPPVVGEDSLESGDALIWQPRRGKSPTWLRSIPPETERRRHIRKYAEGELPPERSFYFRGPKGALRLRAQNLGAFLAIGDGVDDDTWRYHLKKGDYSDWLRSAIKDADLAQEVSEIERAQGAAAVSESRHAVREAINRRYTASE